MIKTLIIYAITDLNYAKWRKNWMEAESWHISCFRILAFNFYKAKTYL